LHDDLFLDAQPEAIQCVRVQELEGKLVTDRGRGLPWQDEAEAELRRKVFGANRMADREDVTFAALFWDALKVNCTNGCAFRLIELLL
jgi:hypothetical protein